MKNMEDLIRKSLNYQSIEITRKKKIYETQESERVDWEGVG